MSATFSATFDLDRLRALSAIRPLGPTPYRLTLIWRQGRRQLSAPCQVTITEGAR
jgi:hypothetical protein